jgi:hypothetical protein
MARWLSGPPFNAAQNAKIIQRALAKLEKDND